MTDKELQAIVERHFARSKNLTFYVVCNRCSKPCVFSKDEETNRVWIPCTRFDVTTALQLHSPLPFFDFVKLANEKANDKDFWEKSDLLEGEGDLDDDD